MDIHVFPIPIPPPTSLSTRSLWVFPVHQFRALVSCIQPGLVICFTATRSSGVVFGCFHKRSQLRGDGCRVIVLLGTVASHWAHRYPIPKPGVLRQLEACVSHCVWRPAGSSRSHVPSGSFLNCLEIFWNKEQCSQWEPPSFRCSQFRIRPDA